MAIEEGGGKHEIFFPAKFYFGGFFVLRLYGGARVAL